MPLLLTEQNTSIFPWLLLIIIHLKAEWRMERHKKKEWFDAGRDLYLWKTAYVKSHFWSVLVCHSSGWVFFFLSLLYSLKYIFILLPHTVQLTKQDLNTDGPKHAQKVSFSSAVSDFIAVNYTKISPLSLQGLALKFS